ncbi:MAG: hypothetical protein AAFV54_14245, partial [Pseudomonadota bacterium]
ELAKNAPSTLFKEIPDLEMIHWVPEEDSPRHMAISEGFRVERQYVSFDELYRAILRHGPLFVCHEQVDIIFTAVGGDYDGHIVAIRQSGRNIRRILIQSHLFEIEFGNFQGCISHIASNNAVGVEVELKHLWDMAKKLDLDPSKVDAERSYNRLEIDVFAALQLYRLAESMIEGDERAECIFKLGFGVGRLFSSAKNIATLEPDARRADEYARSYRERGRKGRSKDRKTKRLEHLFGHIKALVEANPALSRMKPIEVARLAVSDAAKAEPALWSQGAGQLEAYLTTYASDDTFREAFWRLFPTTG